jgi:hypothetical protein
MASIETSGFHIAPDEQMLFLSGLFSNVLRLERARLRLEAEANGAILGEADWERINRDALETVAKFFPEPLRSRISANASDLVAALTGLN